jgi:anti-sigma B factor antagonist
MTVWNRYWRIGIGESAAANFTTGENRASAARQSGGYDQGCDMSTASKPSVPLAEPPRRSGDSAIVTLAGDIDLHNSPEVRSALLQLLAKDPPKRLILDLEKVPYVDSSAIAVFVEALQKLRKTGGKVVLCCLQPRVNGLLEIARLNTIFALAANEQEALTK